jgi:periodic tryptophan protein 1
MDQDVQMNDIAKPKTGDGLDEYNLENYDDDDTAPGISQFFVTIWPISNDITAMGPFSNIKGLTYYRNNEEDPYITMKV